VFREADGAIELEDADGDSRTAQRYIEPVGVVLGDRYHLLSEPI
jgi:hypothetical protein